MPPSREIHAHGGGPLVGGVPAFAEGTLPAFHRARLAQRAVCERDVRLTRDRVPVVVHDETVDRTTDGTGRVCELTADEAARVPRRRPRHRRRHRPRRAVRARAEGEVVGLIRRTLPDAEQHGAEARASPATTHHRIGPISTPKHGSAEP